MSKAIQSTSGTLKYRLKDPKANGESSIILDYSFGRRNRIKFSTGYKVKPKNWDKVNQRIRAVSTINNREKVNSDLLRFSSEFIDAVTKLDEAQKQDRDVLKSILTRIVRGIKEEKKIDFTFFNYADDYIERKENQANNIESIKLKPITVRAYKQTIKRLREFDKEQGYNLNFNNIDLQFYYAFVQYLETQNYSINTIGKHIKNIIALLNRATEDGVNTYLKYKHREFKVLTEESVSIYLTETEIDALYHIDLSACPEWELARDIFLIGYYTGQRVSDYNGISKDQIKTFNGKRVFEFNQQKTNKRVYVPIHSRVEKIMKERYNSLPPKSLNSPDINKYIKKAGRKAGIEAPVTIKKIVHGNRITDTVKKHDLIVTHTARRSFCTNAYLSKMPVIDIMAISGHSTEREFYKYIKVSPQERAVKIADSAFFTN
ncbi:site-specific integrase [Winogradskyella arenosi]|uniref:Site-specific recombinase XerD n=1 Tax=Winogradskyella arenosi TaxID=533325 RepID=A0A368ZJN1_9FLAO|nr:site-specific integrase [Winogradskyella arenosi]RCW93638.1 site-specific recombinase XerD [Winogradskyella arenosi]